MPASEWRLILSNPTSGPLNMALDEAILEAVQAGRALPTLRFYAWEPPCLSIGYAQSVDDVDQSELERLGWDLVRRPTGGKAILHTDELTYSISAPADHSIFRQGVLPSYERISHAILSGLEIVGVAAELHADGLPPVHDENPVCFQNPGAFEITVSGKKLVGSAQVRRGSGVLQHGSIPLRGDLGRICQVLRYDSEQTRRQAARNVDRDATTVRQAVGAQLAWEELADSLSVSFARLFDLSFSSQDPDPSEISRSREIVAERYSRPDWTTRI